VALKKNIGGPKAVDPTPDKSSNQASDAVEPESRATRRSRRESEPEVSGPKTMRQPGDDLNRLDLHREWIAPSRASHRRMRLRRRLARSAVAVVLLAAVSICGYLFLWVPVQAGWNPFIEWFGSPTATLAVEPSPTTSADSSPTAAPTTDPAASPTPTSAALSAQARAELFDALKDRLTSRVADFTSGRYAITYINPVSGESWSLNGEAPFVAASCIKMGINTYLYDQVKAGQVTLDEILTFDRRAYPTGDYEGGTGTIQSQPDGTQYTVAQTSTLSIRVSDNCGINMILRRLGTIETVNANYLKVVAGTVDYRTTVTYKDYKGATKQGKNRISSDDLAKLAADLYLRYAADPDTYQPLIDDLSNTEFGYSIPNLLPEDVKVAHKIGTNGTYYTENDVGIVFAAEPFILCVTTESGSIAKAHEFTAQVAKEFYDFVQTAATGVAPD
jgi:beta-lactamase class A